MSFELKPGESFRKCVRRIARKQIDRVLEQMVGPRKGSRDEAVHEARKSFKKLRALLRLVRPVIDEKVYRKENTCFRDAGRPLTEVRDAKILIETLDGLVEHFAARLTGRSFGGIHKALLANLRSVRDRVLDAQHAFAVVGETGRQARERIEGWADVPNRWSSVGEGVRNVYRQSRDAFRSAAADPTVEKLHEWRKQSKYLRYQLEILRPLWPERMGELADEADRMGELLGDDHDLAVLRQKLADGPESFDDEGVLQGLIDRRRLELQQEALELGGRFFLDKTGDFARRLKGYWKAWRGRSGAKQSGAAKPETTRTRSPTVS